jgi:hypothetical protein
MTTDAKRELTVPTRPQTWQGLERLPRAVVAAFSGHVGQGPTKLAVEDFAEAMHQDFSGLIAASDGTLEALRLPMVSRMHELQGTRLDNLIKRLGELAGGSPGARAVANQVHYTIVDMVPPIDAIPGLQLLSELVVVSMKAPAAYDAPGL